MLNENPVLNYANKLEGLLRSYLNCHYTQFGVKANDNLLNYDWRSPINFALGYRYASSNNDQYVKEAIDYFIGNELQGQSIRDIFEQYEYYGLGSVNEALDYINQTIENLRIILFSE